MEAPANAATRMALFAVGLVAVFGVALAIGRYAVPDQSDRATAPASHSTGHGTGDGDHAATTQAQPVVGTSLTADGYVLTGLRGPDRTGTTGPVSFTITGSDGAPLTRYTPSHTKDLHLIIVRADGAHFAHLHPTRDAAGAWHVDWRAPAAGTYRVFADFVPGDRPGDAPVVLAGDVQVAGDFAPVAPQPARTATVDGFTVTLDGELGHSASGHSDHSGASALTATVRRDGAPVTLQPYLGALGHLVVLRAGDLAYTHVHPQHDHPDHSGATDTHVSFAATPPSSGRYLAYFDFQVDGVVRTAAFVLDSAQG